MSHWQELNGYNLGKFSYDETIKQNIIAFFDWGFINKDGFIDINIPTSGDASTYAAYGGDFSKLKPINDPRFGVGKIWEAPRKNWVWESNLESTQPIDISGIFINNVFYPKSSNIYKIDYPNGRVILNSGINTNSNVRVAYSYKWISVLDINNVNWDNIVQTYSQRPDSIYNTAGSGSYALLSDKRVQLPVVGLEVVETSYAGYEIGTTGAKNYYSRIKYHIIGEDTMSVDRISTLIAAQDEKTIFMFNLNRVAESGKFPLNNFGSPNEGALTYNYLVKTNDEGGYRYVEHVLGGMLSFSKTTKQSIKKLTNNIYTTTVDMTADAVVTNLYNIV